MNNRPRKNVRLSGPGTKPVSTAERAGYLMVDATYRIAEEKIGWTATVLLTMATLIGGGAWMKNTVTDSFNTASSEFSAASVATPLVQDFSTASVPKEEPSTLVDSTFVPPPAQTQTEPNLKDGPLWGADVIPSEAIKDMMGINALSAMMEKFSSLKPGGGETRQRYWTQGELVAKAETHAANSPFSAKLMANLMLSEGYRDRETNLYDVTVPSSTGARGPTQIVKSTLLELMYLNKELLPHDARKIVGNIVATKTYRGTTYYVRGGNADEEKVLKLVEDPDIALILTKAYLRTEIPPFERNYRTALRDRASYLSRKNNTPRERIAALEHALQAPLTNVHAKCVWTLGKGGSLNLAVAMADPAAQNMKAKDFVPSSIVEKNPSLFYGYGKDKAMHPYTVAQAKEHLIKIMGNDPLPRDLSRPQETKLTQISDNPDFRPA